MQDKGLRICIFADERSIHTRRWVIGLRGLGHVVDLVTLRKDYEFDIGGISLGASSKLGYLAKIPALRRMVGRLAPDIFHSHFASSYGFLASFVAHPRKVVSVWGNDIIEFPKHHWLPRMVIRRSIESAHYITATSKFLENTVRNFGWNIPAIIVIPFGIDLGQFQYRERPQSGPIRIGIAKSLLPKYGVDILINAFAEICKSHKDVELQIAGKGSYEDNYRVLVKDLGLCENVKFIGFLAHEKVPHFLSTIDIFAMPSISDGESFGVAALEASATGLPVVASRVGGVPEVVIHGETGFLVERKNEAHLVQAIIKLIDQPELRLKMGQAGRKFVESNYRWEDNLRAMSDLYYSMMK
jgi:glycosyltransferase involved in cell wall biosynthesis